MFPGGTIPFGVPGGSLYDGPPHTLDLYSTFSTEDDGGGRFLTENLQQAGIQVSVARGGASRPSYFSQKQMVIPGHIGVLTEKLDRRPARGWVGKVTHTYDGQVDVAIFTGGFTVGEAYGGIPSLTYFAVEILV